MPDERDVATATKTSHQSSYEIPQQTGMTRVEPQQSRVAQLDERTGPLVFNAEQIALLKRTIAKGATDDELDLFLYQCKRTRLDPFTRQCYFMKRRERNKETNRYEYVGRFETSIDGFRLIAERTGKYRGQKPPEWADVVPIANNDIEIKWYPVWPFTDREPYAARVGVLRADFETPLVAVARWDAYVQLVDVYEGDRRTDEKKLNAMWAKRGAEQLAKCAESLALRQAFPNELSGVYSTEEMSGQPDDVDDDSEAAGRSNARREPPKREPRRTGAKVERSDRKDREVKGEALAIFAGRTVSRYVSTMPFPAKVKGFGLDQNQLTDDKKIVIEREYAVSGDLLARAWDWCDKALSGRQVIDEIVEGKPTGNRVPVVLDGEDRKRFERLKADLSQEMERRQIERDEASRQAEETRASSLPHVDSDQGASQINTESDAEMASLDSVDKGEAYEGD